MLLLSEISCLCICISFFWTLFCFVDLHIFLWPILHLIYYCIFYSKAWNKQCKFYNHFFFFKTILTILGPLHCHIKFRISLYISIQNKMLLFSLDCIKSTNEYLTILTLKYGICICLFRSSLVSLSKVIWFSVYSLEPLCSVHSVINGTILLFSFPSISC